MCHECVVEGGRLVLCGPCAEESVELVETTPMAHFEWCAFCCDAAQLQRRRQVHAGLMM